MLVLFFIKHFIADFLFQTNDTVQKKQKFSYVGHSLMHGLLTFAILFAFNVEFYPAILLSMLDIAIHHLVDYLKIIGSERIEAYSRKYWIAFGLDQLIHYLTYVLIVHFATFFIM